MRDAAGAPVDEAGLLDFVRGRFAEVEDHPVIAAATGRIGTRLSRLTSGAYEQCTELGFPATSVQALARTLRVRMADAGLVPRDIAESGMGYANAELPGDHPPHGAADDDALRPVGGVVHHPDSP